MKQRRRRKNSPERITGVAITPVFLFFIGVVFSAHTYERFLSGYATYVDTTEHLSNDGTADRDAQQDPKPGQVTLDIGGNVCNVLLAKPGLTSSPGTASLAYSAVRTGLLLGHASTRGSPPAYTADFYTSGSDGFILDHDDVGFSFLGGSTGPQGVKIATSEIDPTVAELAMYGLAENPYFGGSTVAFGIAHGGADKVLGTPDDKPVRYNAPGLDAMSVGPPTYDIASDARGSPMIVWIAPRRFGQKNIHFTSAGSDKIFTSRDIVHHISTPVGEVADGVSITGDCKITQFSPETDMIRVHDLPNCRLDDSYAMQIVATNVLYRQYPEVYRWDETGNWLAYITGPDRQSPKAVAVFTTEPTGGRLPGVSQGIIYTVPTGKVVADTTVTMGSVPEIGPVVVILVSDSLTRGASVYLVIKSAGIDRRFNTYDLGELNSNLLHLGTSNTALRQPYLDAVSYSFAGQQRLAVTFIADYTLFAYHLCG